MTNNDSHMDPRGRVGLYSRGKAMYPGGRRGPIRTGTKLGPNKKKKVDWQKLAKERLGYGRS